MSNDAKNVVIKELIYISDHDIMINMENTAETISRLLDVIAALEARLSTLDNL